MQSYPINGEALSKNLRKCVFLKMVTHCLLIYKGCFMVSVSKIWRMHKEEEFLTFIDKKDDLPHMSAVT